MRKLVLPAALLAVALLAGACDANLGGDAASVDGTAISQSTLTSNLSDAASDSIYTCELSSSGTLTVAGSGTKVTGAGSSTYTSPFVAAVLNQLIQVTAVRNELARLHLSASSFARQEATLQLESELTPPTSSATGASGTPTCSGTGEGALKAFPKAYRNQLIELQAGLDVLAAHREGFALTPSGVRAYAVKHGGLPQERFVSIIATQSKAEAQTIAAAINQGASFASEAREHSVDSQSAANGGALGPIPDSEDAGFVKPLNTLIPSLRTGVVSAPVAVTTTSGQKVWLLVLVTKVQSIPLADIASAYLPTLTQGETEVASTALHGARVTVSPAYGSWKNEHGVWEVVPPSGPPASLLPNPSAVGASGASGVLG